MTDNDTINRLLWYKVEHQLSVLRNYCSKLFIHSNFVVSIMKLDIIYFIIYYLTLMLILKDLAVKK